MQRSVVWILAALLAMMPMAVAWAEEEAGAPAEAEGGGGAQDAVDDWYGMLEMQGGTTWDFSRQRAMPYLAGKVGGYRKFVGVFGTEIDVDEETEAKGPVSALGGVTYNLGNLRDYGVEISWAEHFSFNVGLCGTYTFDEGEWGLKAMLSVVDLSFSRGNAERQRKR